MEILAVLFVIFILSSIFSKPKTSNNMQSQKRTILLTNISDARKYGGFVRSDGIYVAYDGNEWPDWHRGCSDCLFAGKSNLSVDNSCLLLAESGFDKKQQKQHVMSIINGNQCQYYGMKDFQSDGTIESDALVSEIVRIAKSKGFW